MKQILVLGASNSRQSINKTFATWAASRLADAEALIVDLNDFEMPLFGVDRQKRDGIPTRAQQFIDVISSSNGIILSLAEHNGSYTTAFKNIIDWSTRIDKSIWQMKPMLLLSTAPGLRGGKSVMETALMSFPHWGGKIISSFSLPSFNENFNVNDGIVNPEYSTAFNQALDLFQKSI